MTSLLHQLNGLKLFDDGQALPSRKPTASQGSGNFSILTFRRSFANARMIKLKSIDHVWGNLYALK